MTAPSAHTNRRADENRRAAAIPTAARLPQPLGGGRWNSLEPLEPRLLLSDGPPAPVEFDWSPAPVHATIGSSGGITGSLAYQNNDIGDKTLNWLGASAVFSFDIDGGQSILLRAVPRDPLLDLAMALKGPDGSILATADRTGAKGEELLLAPAPLPAGLYQVCVQSKAGLGSFRLSVYLNLAMEAEAHGGPANDSLAAAEDLDAAFIPLGGSAARAVISGSESLAALPAIAADGFEAGLGSGWTPYSSDPSGKVVVTKDISPAPPEGSLALKMYRDQNLDYPTLNEAVWTVDLSGVREAQLTFNYLALSGSTETFSGDFTGHANADGIAISDDGIHWHPIWTSGYQGDSWSSNVIDLAYQAAVHGPRLGPGFQVKFQDVDATSTGGDYRAWDNLRIVSPSEDWYRFTLGAGESTTLVLSNGLSTGSRVEVYDNAGTVLAASRPFSNGTDSFTGLINNLVAPHPGTYYARVISGVGYMLLVTRNGEFDINPNSQFFDKIAVAPDITIPGAAFGKVTSYWGREDYFRFSVNAGDTLTVETSTFDSGPMDFPNPLDPRIELRDPSGAKVAEDDNSASDGRNARLTHTATATGTYRVHVFAKGIYDAGDYVVRVSGHTGPSPAFQVTSTDPVDGAYLGAAVDRVTVNFSDFVYLPSLDAPDVTIDGRAAVGCNVINGGTVAFTVPTGLGQGTHRVTIEAGAILDAHYAPINAYSGTFTTDLDAPRVISSSIQEGDRLSTSDLAYTVRFDKPMKATNLDATDFSLVGLAGGSRAPAGWTYDPASCTLAVQYTGLPDDAYTLTLRSGDGRLEDLAGHDLDGEPTAFPIPPFVSGDGFEGGDFLVPFYLDTYAMAVPVPAKPVGPLGSLVYEQSVSGTVQGGGDTDAYLLSLDPGQRLTVAVEAMGDLQPTILVCDPSNTARAEAAARAAGGPAIAQAVPIREAGTWSIVIGGAGGSAGGYLARIVLNAAVEEERAAEATNDAAASAQDIDASFIDLGGIMRGAVVGDLPLLGEEDFEKAVLGAAWSTYSEGTASAKVTSWTAQQGRFSLALNGGGNYNSLSEATWALDLGGRRPGALRFWHRRDEDPPTAFTGDFTGHAYADGIAVSVDGQNWHPVFEPANSPNETWQHYEIDLGAQLEAAGLLLGPTLYLRFQGYGQYANGHMWDDIVLTADTEDWYSLSLSPDQAATLVLSSEGGSAGLELYSPSGTLVAMGSQRGSRAAVAVENVRVPAAGAYYARVTGDGRYALVVTRGVSFDLEQDEGRPDKAQDITVSRAVLGSVASRPGPIATESEPNDNGYADTTQDDFALANDLSGSFSPAGAGAYRAVVTGQVDPGTVREDFFRFYARPGDSLSVKLDGTSPWVGIYDNAKTPLAYNYSSTSTTTGYSKFAYLGDYYIKVTGQASSPYTLTLTLTTVRPYCPNFEDFYAIQVRAGDNLRVETATPFDAPREMANNLDPAVELYDPTGVQVAGDDNGAADGRNARLTHTAARSGAYVIRVLPAAGSGEYVLRVTGCTGTPPALAVTGTNPANGAKLVSVPAQVAVDFSDAVLVPSVGAEDLTIDGRPATGFHIVDFNTIAFDLPAVADGVHNLAIGTGAILGLSGAPVGAYTSGFELDTTPPKVLSSSVAQGDVLPPGTFTYTARFSEGLSTAKWDASDFTLIGLISGRTSAGSWNYDAASSRLTLTYAALAEDTYTLSLLSGNDRFEDLFGNDLDGETPVWPLPAGGSGDGVPGGDFAVSFAVDTAGDRALPTPFAPVGSPGSLVYSTGISSTIGAADDVDTFKAALDAGQTLTVVAEPRHGLQPRISIYGPDGGLAAENVSAGPGLDALVQALAVRSGGTYAIVVTGAATTAGAYDLKVTLNALVEAEERGGAANNEQASAQGIDAGFIDLGGGQRGAVLGTLPPLAGRILAKEDFSSGVLSSDWSIYTVGAAARVVLYAQGKDYYMHMDYSEANREGLAEAVWNVNLAGAAGAVLTFGHSAYYGKADPFGGPFVGHANADGIAISGDGVTWYPLWNAPITGSQSLETVSVDLGAGSAAAGIALGPDFKIKFQNYEKSSQTGLNRAWDNLQITTSEGWHATASENFESGTLGPAWTPWTSDPAGRVYATGAYGSGEGAFALAMEQTTNVSVLDEAVWAVDLSGRTGALLSFSYTDYGYYFQGMTYPDFTGHQNFVGVAISADGNRWHPVWADRNVPDGQWKRFSIDLAAEAAKFGITVGQIRQIKFQASVSGSTAGQRFLWDGISIDTADDWYKFSLGDGQAATLALKTVSGGNTDLALFDASGTLLALGGPYATTADEVIADLVAPLAGTYYARISSCDAADYLLLLTRGASLDGEPNGNDNLDGLATAQEITSSGTALGYLSHRVDKLYAYRDTTLWEIDPQTGTVTHVIPAAVWQGSFYSMASTRTSLLLFGDQGNGVKEVDPATGALVRTIGSVGSKSDMAFMNNEIFLTDYYAGDVTVLDYATGQVKRTIKPPGLFGYHSSGLASSGSALYGATSGNLYRIDPQTGAATLLGTLSQSTSCYAIAILGDELFVLKGQDIDVYGLSTLAYRRTFHFGSTLYALAGDGGLPLQDFYAVQVNAGDSLTVYTTVPAGEAGEFTNDLDPAIELYRPDGVMVAADDNSAGDGRNARLTHVATTSGRHVVRVLNTAGSGQYVLNVRGYSGSPPTLGVASMSVPDGTLLGSALTQVTVNFDAAVLLPTLDPQDLTIDGTPAAGLRVVDADTVVLTLPTAPDGTHTMAIAAGAVRNLQGMPIRPFSSRFTLDAQPPRVIRSSIQEGDVLTAGRVTCTIQFNEPLLAMSLDAADFSLVSQFRGAFQPATWNYAAGTSTLTLDYTDLPEDDYTLALVSGNNAFEDLIGHDLDGEAVAWPIGPNVSGNGTEGGNFVLHFATDVAVYPFLALKPVAPLGSLVYDAAMVGRIGTSEDEDVYSLELDPGQKVTVVVAADAALVADAAIISPANLVIRGAPAAGPGRRLVLETVPADAAGTYFLRIRGADGTTGTYSLEVLLNAVAERESYGQGAANNDTASAEDLDASAVDLSGGLSRLAARGALGVAAQENFENGRLGPGWSTYASSADAVVGVSTEKFGAFGSGALLMWHRYPSSTSYSLKEAVWTVDLSGLTDARLRFWHSEILDGEGGLTNNFSGHAYGDGIAISTDGLRWHPVWIPSDLPNSGRGDATAFYPFEVNLSAEAATAGLALGPGFQIKFQQYGERSGGRLWDEVAIQTPDAADLYAFTLRGGETATLGATALEAGDVRIEVLGGDGQVLAAGRTGPTNLDQVISDFVAPAAGRYYLRVTGTPGAAYSVVVTRGAGFDTERNNAPGPAGQDITLTGAIAGDVGTAHGRLFSLEGYSTFKWAMERDPVTGVLRRQFNIPLASETGSIMGATTTEWSLLMGASQGMPLYEVELDSWRVVRSLPNPGYNIYAMAFRDNEIFISPYLYNPVNKILVLDYETGALKRTLNTSQFAYSLSVSASRLYAGNSATLYEVDPLTGAMTLRGQVASGYSIYAVSGDEIIAYSSGSSSSGTLAAFDLKTFALRRNLCYVSDVKALATGDGALDDYVRVEARTGDTLTLSTATPRQDGGRGALTGSLDPALDLFAPNGVRVAGDSGSAADGRNCLLTYTVPAAGTYTVRVTAERGTHGEYVLTVRGATGAASAFTVRAVDPKDGAELTAAPSRLTLDFSSGVLLSTLTPGDLRIRGQSATGVTVVDGDTIAFDLPALAEGVYDVELPAGGVLDVRGRPNVAFTSRFAVRTFVYPTPLVAMDPFGSMVYRGPAVSGVIPAAGNSCTHTLALDGGQALTVGVVPAAGLRPTVSVYDPNGALVAMATAGAPGKEGVLQALPVVVSGTYKVAVLGADNTTGTYTVQLTCNAALEAENHGGPVNNSLATAQDLDPVLASIGPGASRGAVIGDATPATEPALVKEDFERGFLDSSWTTYASATQGRIQVRSDSGAGGGTRALLMDRSTGSSSTLNEATWRVDLSGLDRAYLNFKHAEWSDGETAFSGTFTGHYNADGIAISADGTTWRPVWNAPNQSSGVWITYTIDLAAEAAAGGIPLGSNFLIRFQQYGTDPIPSNGRGWDEISVTTATDYYRFTLDSNQPVTLAADGGAAFTVELFSAAGQRLATGAAGPVTVTDIAEVFIPSGTLSGPQDAVVGPDANLYVSNYNGNNVLRYNGQTGAYLGVFVAAASGGMDTPRQLLFGPNGDLFLASRYKDAVYRYNGKTGAFISQFVKAGAGGLSRPFGLTFGPDGNLYVAGASSHTIHRYNGATGAFIDNFVPYGSGGLSNPCGIAFGPDGNLYVAGYNTDSILRYNGQTGAFIDTFVPAGSGGLGDPIDLAFGPDGALYVCSYASNNVLAFDGRTGAFLKVIVKSSTTGYNGPQGLTFGPNKVLYTVGCQSNTVLRSDFRNLAKPVSVIREFRPASAGTYYARIVGAGEYNLAVVRGAAFDVETNDSQAEAKGIGPGVVLGGLGESPFARDDYYSLAVKAGDSLILSTSTPGDGLYEFASTLDPAIELFGPTGNSAALDRSSAPDGRNARLAYVAPVAGTYKIRVYAEAGTGVYLLTVIDPPGAGTDGPSDETPGAAADAIAPAVTRVVLNRRPERGLSAIDPGGAGITVVDVTFSEPVVFTGDSVRVETAAFPGGVESAGETLGPADITGSGTRNLTFTFSGASVVDTWIKVTLNAGLITDLAGNGLDGEAPPAGSGLGYLHDSAWDLPTGDGTPGGDAVFYLGSLRGDFNRDGWVTEADRPGFTAAWREKSLDADFRGVGFGPRPPDGQVTIADINGFTSLYQAGLAARRHLDPLPVGEGGQAAGVTELPALASAGGFNLMTAVGQVPSVTALPASTVGSDDTDDPRPLDLLAGTEPLAADLDPLRIMGDAGSPAVLRM